MSQCEHCGKEAPEAKNRNRIKKQYCSDKCRWAAHNRKKFNAFEADLIGLLKKYGYLNDQKN